MVVAVVVVAAAAAAAAVAAVVAAAAVAACWPAVGDLEDFGRREPVVDSGGNSLEVASHLLVTVPSGAGAK